LDIGVLGYIGIVWPKEHSPEVWSFPPVTLCINAVRLHLHTSSGYIHLPGFSKTLIHVI